MWTFKFFQYYFRLWGVRYFIFANSGYVWNEKEEWEQKETLGTGIFPQTRNKKPFNNLTIKLDDRESFLVKV